MIEISKEIIYRIICDHSNGSDLPMAEYMANRLKEIQSIAQQIHYLQDKQYKIKAEYQNALSECGKELFEIQKKCKHESRKFHPDASGNNDSWTSCEICDKEIK
jgi:DNA-binding transcriptional regulator WhiA